VSLNPDHVEYEYEPPQPAAQAGPARTVTVMSHVLRVIDPAGLSPAQLSGDRCVLDNCRKRLGDNRVFFGCLPDGTPVFVCDDH
jgi:hypothetical protein